MIPGRNLFIWIFMIALGGAPAAAQVKAWEGTIDLPTYAWEDDPYPQFWALDGKIVYPYTMQEVISTTKENRTYKALFLENDFLKITCLPQLGGRIFSVLNKVNGQEMFHRNDVVKPGLIGMRGAWISGGIEWNTGPHGHTVTAISPVNALVQENSDGSATLHISNTEQIFRTRWNVNLTLYPDRSFLHEKIRIYNPQDGIHPYYFWNCTAFPCGEGTRFIFPMNLGCDHNGTEFFTWPIHEGKDISWLKNYDRPTSIFAWECDQDFFGCYDVDLDKGLVQVADHRVLKGKKAWTWGQSEDGRVSQQALADEDGPYIEVQSGPLRTQADYGELAPRQEVAWEEWWYPVFGFDQGFDYATRDVVIEVGLQGEGEPKKISSIQLLSTRVLQGCQLTFHPDGGDEQKFSVDLTPKQPQSVKVSEEGFESGKVILTDKEDKTLAEFHYPLPLSPHSIPEIPTKKPEEEMTVDELFAEALERDRSTSRTEARELYEKVIEKDGDHADGLFRLGVLDFEAGLLTEAKGRFKSALEKNPDHVLARYFHGVCDFRLGNYSEALRTADRVSEIAPDLSIGYDLKGRALMRLGRRDQVPPLFEQAAKVDPEDTRAWEHLAMSFFGAGRSTDAYALAKDLLDQDPTLLIPQGILAMKDPTKPGIIFEAVLQFLGEADFELAEAQMAFEGLGMPRVAFMFTVPLMAPPLRSIYSPSPMQHFYSCALALMTSSAPTAKKIEELLGDWSADKRFPSRIESVQVLELLKQSHPGDGRFALMRGNALANLGRISEATAEWESAIQKDPSLAQAHRNLGLYFWKEKKDLKRADAFYRRAIDLDPKGQTLYSELSSILSETPEEVVALLEKLGTDQFRLNELSERLAQAYNDLGEYPRTIAFLEKRVFSNWEARTTSRNLWVRALIERGKKAYEGGDLDAGLRDFEAALTYPRNLGVGRPAEPEEAEALYWCGMTYLKLGKAAEAKSAFEQGSLGDGGGETQKEYRMKCSEELLKQP